MKTCISCDKSGFSGNKIKPRESQSFFGLRRICKFWRFWAAKVYLLPVSLLLIPVVANAQTDAFNGPGSNHSETAWEFIQNEIQENFYAVIVGLMLVLVTLAFSFHRSHQLANLRKSVVKSKEQEISLQKLAMDKHSIVSVTDPDGTIKYVNDNFVKISGYAAKELLGTNILDLYSDKKLYDFFSASNSDPVKGKTWSGEMRTLAKNGECYWIVVTFVAFFDENNRLEKVISVGTDISETKRAQKEITQFKSTLDLVDSAIFMFWPDSLKFFYLNKTALRQTGWREGEYFDYTPKNMNSIFEESRFRKLSAPLVSGDLKFVQFETVGLENRPIEFQLQLVSPEGGDPRFVVTTRDITERVKANREIRQFKTTLDLTADLIFMNWPASLKYFYQNKAAQDVTGWTNKDLVNKTPADLLDVFDLKALETVTEPLRTGEQKIVTYETKGESGVPYELSTQLLKPSGEKPRFVTVARNILDRKEAEREIRLFKTTLDRIDEAVYMFWPDTLEFFYVNQAALDLAGVNNENELVGKTPAFVNPEYREEVFRNRLAPLISGEKSSTIYQTVHVKKSGQIIPIEVHMQLIRPEGQPARFVAISRDITERNAADNQISQLKNTLDRIEDPVYMFWPDSLKFFYVNQAALEFSGKSAEEFESMTPADLSEDFDLQEFRLRCKPLVFGTKNSITYETVHVNAEGEKIPFEARLQIVVPENDEPRFIAITRDITKKKEVEKAKSEFVATVSHELRTPLTSIKGALGLVRVTTDENDEKTTRLLEIALKNCNRLVSLINDILDIEKGDAGMLNLNPEVIDLKNVILNSIDANQGYADSCDVSFALEPISGPIMIKGDEDRLMQVMANLMSNAAKFSNKGGKIEIRTETLSDMVRLYIKDYGSGIPESAQASIFEKFTQADSSDQRQKAGTGLGLSIARSIVEAHGGVLDFVSEEGVGTTFFFDLKLATTESKQVEDPQLSEPVDGVTVLVIEDDPDIAHLLRLLLEKEDYKVICAHNSKDALSVLANQSVDCITVDVGLPDVDGITLLKKIRRNKKTRHIPAVVVSADSDGLRKGLVGSGIGVIDWIQKPIDESKLVDKLGAAIRSHSSERPLILHVEDDADTQEIVKSLVGELADIKTAPTIAKAKNLLKRNTFDLIILDISLPDGNGECLLPLVDHVSQIATPVIVFSAREASSSIVERVNSTLSKTNASNQDLVRTIEAAIHAQAVNVN